MDLALAACAESATLFIIIFSGYPTGPLCLHSCRAAMSTTQLLPSNTLPLGGRIPQSLLDDATLVDAAEPALENSPVLGEPYVARTHQQE